MYYGVTRDDDDEEARRDPDAPKDKVLHTRVPAVLDEELKRLAKNLRVPVSNVVRAILEDAIDAVDTVGARAEGEIKGFVDRLHKQRGELRDRVARREHEDRSEEAPSAPKSELPPCPAELPEILEGVFGYQPMVLATETSCSVCGRKLPAGSDAHRALFDEPGRRVFLGPECRLVPEKGKTP
jgi:hypothetical protein